MEPCPFCRSEVAYYLINVDQIVVMCSNASCPFPFNLPNASDFVRKVPEGTFPILEAYKKSSKRSGKGVGKSATIQHDSSIAAVGTDAKSNDISAKTASRQGALSSLSFSNGQTNTKDVLLNVPFGSSSSSQQVIPPQTTTAATTTAFAFEAAEFESTNDNNTTTEARGNYSLADIESLLNDTDSDASAAEVKTPTDFGDILNGGVDGVLECTTSKPAPTPMAELPEADRDLDALLGL